MCPVQFWLSKVRRQTKSKSLTTTIELAHFRCSAELFWHSKCSNRVAKNFNHHQHTILFDLWHYTLKKTLASKGDRFDFLQWAFSEVEKLYGPRDRAYARIKFRFANCYEERANSSEPSSKPE